jgi:archaellum biogenesis protein FlaJ (TadC family)
MTSSKWFRQIHRWLSIAFTLAAIVNVIALVQQKQSAWIGFMALLPLIALLITGLYLFALPYFSKRRSESSIQEDQCTEWSQQTGQVSAAKM